MTDREFEKNLLLLMNKVEGNEEKTWGDLVAELQLNIHPDSLRKAFNTTPYSGYNITQYFLQKIEDGIEDKESLSNLKFDIIKERKKVQALNNEYYKNAREQGRYELFLDNINDSINNLKPIQIKNFECKKENLHRTGVLVLSDAHYGREIEMKGLFSEKLNVYNPKEFENRMWNLLRQLEQDCKILPIDKLSIIECGDMVEGILRLGESLKNLKTGVTDSAIQYAEFMANWIIECYNKLEIPIEYSLTSGNHDVLRLLESKANFEEETVAKFIYNHIKLRIENSILNEKINHNRDIDIKIKPYNDMIYNNYYGLNVLAYHGDTKNMKADVSFFEDYYNITIDILIAGHLHRGSNETIGVSDLGDKEIIRVPSICGIDTYSKKIRGNARAGVKYFIFDENGKNWEKTFFLN